MKKFNLAFSGGGFRAAFFCLGAYRRLVELGVDEHVKTISSVSGGSITAAVIMRELVKGPFQNVDDFDAHVTKGMKDFGRAGFRNKVILDSFLPPRKPLWPILPRARFSSLAPITLDKKLFNRILAEAGRENITNMKLNELPEYPLWVCNATNLHTLKRISFSRTKITDEVYGDSFEVSDISVAAAVAASAAFPLLFEPVRLDVKKRSFSKTEEPFSFFLLTDGGIYDNLGSEEFLAQADNEKSQPVPYMIFDASARRKHWTSKEKRWWGKRQLRVLDVSMDQVAELRKKMIRKHDSEGVQLFNVETINENKKFQTDYWNHYWEITGSERRLALPDYPDQYEEIERMLAVVRTDLDKFSEVEMGMLMWAGAMRADLGCKVLFTPTELQELPKYHPRTEVPEMTDYTGSELDVAAILNGLKFSHKRRINRRS